MILPRLGLASILVLLAGGTPPPAAPVELVGSYYQGDGLGVNQSLELLADGRFTYSWDGCLGNYDSQSGTWQEADGIITFEVVTKSADAPPDGLPPKLRLVHWGARLYLVEPSELETFSNDVNAGMEPRKDEYGSFYLRREDWNVGVSGLPDVGRVARAFLLAEPIRGKIVKALDGKRVRVNVGARNGLRVGMRLFYQGVDAFAEYRVVTVADDSAEARVDPDIGDATPKAGPVSTLLWDPSLRGN